MVAAKRGINPMYLMHKLQHSYYKRYTGFGLPMTEDESITHPSTIVYNLDELKLLAEKKENNEKEEMLKEMELEEAEVISVEEGKSDMLTELQKRKAKLQQRKFEHETNLLISEKDNGKEKTETGKYDSQAKRSRQVGRKKKSLEEKQQTKVSEKTLRKGKKD
jgi:hypothetical protein